jgi:hypothetical protein
MISSMDRNRIVLSNPFTVALTAIDIEGVRCFLL